MNQSKRSIPQLFMIYMLVLSLTLTMILGIFWIYETYTQFKKDAEKMQEELLEEKKFDIKNETEKVIDYIEYKRSQADSNFKENIKAKVLEAYNISTYIYEQNKQRKSKQQIKKDIKNALYPIRFNNNKSYIFIFDMKGDCVLLPGNDELEGKNFLTIETGQEKYPVKEIINEIEQKKEGFFKWFPNENLSDSLLTKKVSFVKYFAPFDWWIGTGGYYASNAGELQNEILKRVSNIRFGKEGYIFINTYNGVSLLANGKLTIPPKKRWEVTASDTLNSSEDVRQAANQPGGAYVEYKWKKLSESAFTPKVSYIKSYPDWEWIIGAGVYIDDIDKTITREKNQLFKTVRSQILRISIILLVSLLFINLIARYISQKTKLNFAVFTSFFEKAARESTKIDESELNFKEFEIMAHAANQMIDERNLIEESLERQHSLLRYLIDSIPDLIYFKNKKGTYLGCNKAYEKFIGLKEKQLTGKTDFDLLPEKEADKNSELDQQILFSGQKAIRYEDTLTNSQGKDILFDTVRTPFFDSRKNVLGIICISRDITDMKKVQQDLEKAKEKAEESDKLKSAFLANMSHEIRSPMNAIIGFSRLLAHPNLTKDKRKEYIDLITSSGNNLLNLINDIIDIAKIEAGQLKIKQGNCSVNKMISELKITFDKEKISRGRADIKIKTSKAKKQPDFAIKTDPLRLRQIISNLITNALKFTPSGYIEFGYNFPSEKEIRFYVKDTGIGISKDKINKIFERFGQVENREISNRTGTGLGLAISEHLTYLLGGELQVESVYGEGSTFYFTIPLKKADSTKQKSSIEATRKKYSWKGLSILVAEDNPINQKLISDTIGMYINGVQIEEADNGREAIKKLDQNNYDLILMDIRMPEMDGYETTVYIRNKMKSPKNKTPILGLSAHAMKEEKMKCLSLGMDAYLTKPFKLDEFFEAIDKLAGQNKTTLQKIKPAKKTQEKNKTQHQFLNLELLEETYSDRPDKLQKTLELCLRQIPPQIVEIEKNYQQQNIEAIQAIAHSLKSVTHYLGIEKLYNISVDMEKNASLDNDLNKKIQSFKNIWEKAKTEIKIYLKSLS